MPLPLPIAPAVALDKIVAPAMELLPVKMSSDEADVMLLAIALQESGLAHRAQVGGPARGLWQFEPGGVRGVLQHPAAAEDARKLCEARQCQPIARTVYMTLEHDDILACGFARLLLWTDPRALPELGDQAGALKLYRRTWRPGKFAPERWPDNYAIAVATVRSAA